MKRQRLFLSIFAAALAILTVLTVFTACASNKDEPKGTEEPEENAVTKITLTIAGNDISSYKIVYAPSEYSSIAKKFKNIYTEYEFYRMTADEVCSRIAELTGVTLEVEKATASNVSEHEIIIGPAKRDESKIYDDMSVYDYKDTVVGGKLVLGGGYNTSEMNGNRFTSYAWGATYHAWDAVEEYLREQMAAKSESVDLAEGFTREGKAPLKTVACIGDSITEGYASSDNSICAYPWVMQRLLWKDYVVINYGKSGMTMRDDLNDHYKDTDAYNAAVKNAANFDLVLIMLGTNDSDRDPNFSAADDKMFNDSALGLAETLYKSSMLGLADDLYRPNGLVHFVIMNCPKYFGNGNFASRHVLDLQNALPDLFEENGYGKPLFFDMNTFTKNELTAARFPDKLHPDDEGYYMIGQKLAEEVPGWFAQSEQAD